MKLAQCKYTQAGVEITLNVYFDLKAFDFMTSAHSQEQEAEMMRLTCDSIAAALPRENAEKYFFVKRIVKIAGNRLMLFCTDGFLIDGELILPASAQAYSSERVKLSEIDQLPTRIKLSNDLLKSLNERLPAFEVEARKNAIHENIVTTKESGKQKQMQTSVREFKTEKSSDALAAITQIKKEIHDIAENDIKTLAEKVKKLQGLDAEKHEALMQKVNDIMPINEKFVAEADEAARRITLQTEKLSAFRQHVIHALYESAKEFQGLVLKKMQDAPLHVKKTLQSDFNKKFSEIAVISESGELSSLEQTQDNLDKLSLENLQEIISNDSKEAPGLLQKCNTSWTEESPELQIVMKHLAQLNKTLSAIFKDDPKYARQEMTQIIRTPFPRSFQFKFTESAMNYKNVVDDFCKTQKDNLMTLANTYKKTLQLHALEEKPKTAPAPVPSTTTTQTETTRMSAEEFPDLHKRKEASDTILHHANKDHEMTNKLREKTNKSYGFISQNIDPNLKSLADKMNMTFAKSQDEAAGADKIMHELTDTKSQIDIKINHYILHPQEKPELNTLDKMVASMEEKRNLLLTNNKTLLELNKKLTAYENIIRRIQEIDLLATKDNMIKQRNEAKQFLLQVIQNASSSESLKQRMVDQYAKVDTNAASIDKSMNEVTSMQTSIFKDMAEPDISAEKLEASFKAIAEKMQVLSKTVNMMNENVTGLKKMSVE